MATVQTTSVGGEVLVYTGLLVILVGLLVSVHALFAAFSEVAFMTSEPTIPPLAWAGLLVALLGGGLLATIGTVLSLTQ